jgi:hypothetical protein
MSAICTEKWKTLPDEQWQKIEQVRLDIPRERRPSKKAVELVVLALAWRFIDGKGYVDSSIDQILADCKTLSRDRIEWSLFCLSQAGVLITVRRSTQGLKGQSGRAPRRVFSFYNPKNLVDVRDQQMVSAVVPVTVIPAQNVCPQVDFDFESNNLLLNSKDPRERFYGQKALDAYKELVSGKA